MVKPRFSTSLWNPWLLDCVAYIDVDCLFGVYTIIINNDRCYLIPRRIDHTGVDTFHLCTKILIVLFYKSTLYSRIILSMFLFSTTTYTFTTSTTMGFDLMFISLREDMSWQLGLMNIYNLCSMLLTTDWHLIIKYLFCYLLNEFVWYLNRVLI